MMKSNFKDIQKKIKNLLNSPYCPLLSLGVGIAGQLLLENDFIALAILLYCIAIILFVISTQKIKLPDFQLNLESNFQERPFRRLGIVSGFLSVFFAILSFIRFDNENPVSTPWLLHFCSIGLVILSADFLDKQNTANTESKKSWIQSENIILFAILILAFFVRLYRLDQIPFGLWYDEADFGINARSILQQPGFFPVFFNSSRVTAYYIYLIALSFKIFGISIISIRYVSVIFGVLTVLAGYYLGKELFFKRTALIFAFLLAVSRWDINWSRIGLDNITVPFFEIITLYFLVKGLKNQRFLNYAFAGISLGFGLSFYASFRIFPIVLAIIFIHTAINKYKFLKNNWIPNVFFILVTAITIVPILKFSVSNPDDFWSRINQTSIFAGKTPKQAWNAVAETTKEHLLMFNFQGDRNGRHNVPGMPMLDPVSGTLMVLGVGFCLKRFRKLIPLLLIGWLLLMLAPGIFSLDFESPQSLRAIGSLPAAYLLAAMAAVIILKRGEGSFLIKQQQILNVVILIILGTAGIFNYLIYFDKQARSFDSWAQFSTRETIIGSKMAEFGNECEYFISTFYYNTPSIKFLAPDIARVNVLQTYDSLPFQFDGDRQAIIFIDDGRKMLFDQAMRLYPGGEFEEIKSPDGKTILYQVILNPDDIQQIQGLNANYFENADFNQKPTVSRKETNFSFNFQDHVPLSMPYGVEFSGIINAPTYGDYAFRINSSSMVAFMIDGEIVQPDNEINSDRMIRLAKGDHAIKIRATASEEKFEIIWKRPDSEWEIISAKSLFVDLVTNNGLLGRYFENESWQGEPVFEQVDPWINFYYHNLIVPRPYTVNWSGKILITEGGMYAFGLESQDESSIFIDDVLVLPLETRTLYQEGIIELDSGYHKIEVLFSDHTGYSFINLYWAPPNRDREIIPQKVLFFQEKD